MSGCSWQTSLLNKKAERNDFLLLHKFHDLKLILPEKRFIEKKKTGGFIDEDAFNEGNDFEDVKEENANFTKTKVNQL